MRIATLAVWCSIGIAVVPPFLAAEGRGLYLRGWQSFADVPTIDDQGDRHPSSNAEISRRPASISEYVVNSFAGVAMGGCCLAAFRWFAKLGVSPGMVAWALIGLLYSTCIILTVCESIARRRGDLPRTPLFWDPDLDLVSIPVCLLAVGLIVYDTCGHGAGRSKLKSRRLVIYWPLLVTLVVVFWMSMLYNRPPL